MLLKSYDQNTKKKFGTFKYLRNLINKKIIYFIFKITLPKKNKLNFFFK